jgi:hypothetical protein
LVIRFEGLQLEADLCSFYLREKARMRLRDIARPHPPPRGGLSPGEAKIRRIVEQFLIFFERLHANRG